MNNIDVIKKYSIAVLFFGLAIILLSSCQHSPKKNYYLLSATSTEQTSTAINQTIGLGPIELADYLESTHIVRNANVHHMQFAAQDYWGEPLDKGIARVLAVNLMNLNSARLIAIFPWRRDTPPIFVLRLTIYDLKLINGEAVINASWKLVNNDTKIVLTQERFVRNKHSGNSPADIAAVYSELLGELAGEMDRALTETL